MLKEVDVMLNHRPTGTKALVKVGDIICFACNGRGRGGHYGVTAVVTKVNKKTLACTEKERSYRPGTLWVITTNTYHTIETFTAV
jgi:hypothetical protein